VNEDETLDPDSQEDINTVDQPPSDQLGSDQFVGPYKILRQMGHGGMGTVYLGTRTDQDFKRLFAIKVIRKGMDTEAIIERFRTERRILAGLDHTNIARLIDGGTTTEGLPYFVMEYIEGLPLTKYCDSQRLTTKERLNVFLEICSAVQYAHRNLIVHRDLKPGNILVTSAGVPKLLDFGIAKILNPEFISTEFQPTATEFPIMTPHYASPEQSRGEAITTASDVYSLGVILYELLTGSRPYNFTGANYQEIQKVICEQEPEKPSSLIGSGNDTNKIITLTGSTSEKLQKELQGDLDNIILMALRKEPNRRYSSVEGMMADLQNYLESRPVLARKSTWSYRAGKYVKRNTAAVIAASVVSLLLIAFAITLSIQNARILQQRNEAIQAKQKAQKEEKKAETERLKAVQVTDFLLKLFESNDPNQTKGATLTARQILTDLHTRSWPVCRSRTAAPSITRNTSKIIRNGSSDCGGEPSSSCRHGS
jgi:eukaryotic-like serine/threonine-protein kinase